MIRKIFLKKINLNNHKSKNKKKKFKYLIFRSNNSTFEKNFFKYNLKSNIFKE
jgi:hypothetical protein